MNRGLEFSQLPEGKLVEEYASSFLRRGREGWDEPHTRAVVFYADQIAQSQMLSRRILSTAAWFHDIGYANLFADTTSHSYMNVLSKKEEHMIVGAKLTSEFFDRLGVRGRFTSSEKRRIIHLVRVHDLVEQLSSIDELVLMEADTLGAIAINRGVIPTYNQEDGLAYLAKLKVRRIPRFITTLGKQLLEEMLPTFESYFTKPIEKRRLEI